MFVKTEGLVLPVTNALAVILEKLICEATIDEDSGVLINFRDPDYSAESGGYHPVEIALNHEGAILYITDFSYVGSPPFHELAKELDFDLYCGLFQQMGIEHPIVVGRELYTIWEENFCHYYHEGVYQMEVSSI